MTKQQQSAKADIDAEDMVTEETKMNSNDRGKAAAGETGSSGEDTQVAAEADTASAASVNSSAAESGPTESTGVGMAERVSQLEAQLKDTEGRLVRTLADFDNFRRRTRQEQVDLQKFAAKKVLEGLLPVVDNFERALSALEGKDIPGDLQTGVEMVYRQLQNLLTEQGVTVMDAVGKPFDPQVHEAVMQEPAAGNEAGIVLQELQKGYLLGDKVLRPAMVKVSV